MTAGLCLSTRQVGSSTCRQVVLYLRLNVVISGDVVLGGGCKMPSEAYRIGECCWFCASDGRLGLWLAPTEPPGN